MERRTLGQYDLHLWLAHSDDPADSDHFKRSVLGRYCGTDGQALGFETGVHGKPTLTQSQPGACMPQFNLSHSETWIILAVSGSAPVGVHLQHMATPQNPMKLARRFFSEQEVDALEILPPAQRIARFYDLWALKEAAVKARGEALPPQLSQRRFSIIADDGKESALTLRAFEQSRPDRAQYGLYAPLAGFRLALCWLSADGVMPRMRLFRADQPGEVEVPLPEPLAMSTVQR